MLQNIWPEQHRYSPWLPRTSGKIYSNSDVTWRVSRSHLAKSISREGRWVSPKIVYLMKTTTRTTNDQWNFHIKKRSNKAEMLNHSAMIFFPETLRLISHQCNLPGGQKFDNKKLLISNFLPNCRATSPLQTLELQPA